MLNYFFQSTGFEPDVLPCLSLDSLILMAFTVLLGTIYVHFSYGEFEFRQELDISKSSAISLFGIPDALNSRILRVNAVSTTPYVTKTFRMVP